MHDFWIYSSIFPFISHHLQFFCVFGQEHIRSVLLQDLFDGKLVGQAYLTFFVSIFFFGPTLTRGWLACFLFFVYYFIPPRVSWLHYFFFIFWRILFHKSYCGETVRVVLLRYPKNFAMFKK